MHCIHLIRARPREGKRGLIQPLLRDILDAGGLGIIMILLHAPPPFIHTDKPPNDEEEVQKNRVRNPLRSWIVQIGMEEERSAMQCKADEVVK